MKKMLFLSLFTILSFGSDSKSDRLDDFFDRSWYRENLVEDKVSSLKAMTFSPCGKILVMAEGEKIHVADNHKKKPTLTFKSEIGSVNAIAFSPKKNTYLMASEEGTISAYDLETNRLIINFISHSKSPINAISFLSNDSFVSGNDAGGIICWDLREKAYSYGVSYDKPVKFMALSPDGRKVLCGSEYSLSQFTLEKSAQPLKIDDINFQLGALKFSSDTECVVGGDRFYCVQGDKKDRWKVDEVINLPKKSLITNIASLYSGETIVGLSSGDLYQVNKELKALLPLGISDISIFETSPDKKKIAMLLDECVFLKEVDTLKLRARNPSLPVAMIDLLNYKE